MNAAIQQIMHLPADLRGIAFIEAVEGKHIRNLHGLASHILERENRPSGFISIDERDEDSYSLHEHLAAADPADLLDYRRAIFDEQTETVLSSLAGGAAAIGRSLGLTDRRGQQIVQRQLRQTAAATAFQRGGRGQGVLFGFDGEVA